MAGLLDDLLKEAEDQGLVRKKKKSEFSMSKEKEQYTFLPIKDRYKSISIVLLLHTTHCDCCESEWQTPNKPLVKRVSPKGDAHYKDTISRTEYDKLPRVVEHRQYTVSACSNCFEDGDWGKGIEVPIRNEEELITNLIREVESNEPDEEELS